MNKSKKTYLKGNNGITLIALVVTIIVLIILAGISINLVLGDNGIIARAKLAKEEYNIEIATEKLQMAIGEYEIIQGEKSLHSVINKIEGIESIESENGAELPCLVILDGYEFLLKEGIEIIYQGTARGIAPQIQKIEKQSSEEEVKIVVVANTEDAEGLKEIIVLKNNEILERIDVNGQEITKSININENGNYQIKVIANNGRYAKENVEINELVAKEYFYNNGKEEEIINISYYAEDAIEAVKSENSIDIVKWNNGGRYGSAYICPSNKIDLGMYDKVCLKINVKGIVQPLNPTYSVLLFGIIDSIDSLDIIPQYNRYKEITTVGEQVIEIDTSDLSGEWYIHTCLKGMEGSILEIYGILNEDERKHSIKSISVKKSIKDSTDTSVKIFASAKSRITGEKIKGEYEYYLRKVGEENYTKISTTSEEFEIIDGLELNEKYELYVIAIDENGNKRQSDIITFYTKEYLYNLGDEVVEKTGGWEGKFHDGTNISVGSYEKGNDYMKIETTGTWTEYRLITNNTLNLTEINKIYIDCEIYNGNGGYAQIKIGNHIGDVFYYNKQEANYSYSGTIELDVSNIENKNCQLFIAASNLGNIKINKIWIE